MAFVGKTRTVPIEITATDKTKAAIESAKGGFKGFAQAAKSSVGQIAAGFTVGALAVKAFEGAMTGVRTVIQQTFEATQVAARIQVLNRVFLMTGRNAGYSTGFLQQNKKAIIELGIAEQEAIQIGQRFIQAQLDLADATKIARAAQDLAVIAGTNSSEAAVQLTDAIVKQRPILLKQFGIIADLNDIYSRQATTLGKTVEALSEAEKRQGFLNEILRQSKTVAGAYESAMEDVGKRMTSLPRHVQTFQNALGKILLPVLKLAVDGLAEFLKTGAAVIDFLRDTFGPALRPVVALLEGFRKAIMATGAAIRDLVKSDDAPVPKLGTSYEALASKVERANEAFAAGAIALNDYKAQIDAALVGLDEKMAGIIPETARLILENTKNVSQAQTALIQLMEDGAISGEQFSRIWDRIQTEFNVRRAAALASGEDAGPFGANVLENLNNAVTKGLPPVVQQMADALRAEMKAKGGVFFSREVMEDFLRSTNAFTEEEIALFFGDRVKKALDEVANNLPKFLEGVQSTAAPEELLKRVFGSGPEAEGFDMFASLVGDKDKAIALMEDRNLAWEDHLRRLKEQYDAYLADQVYQEQIAQEKKRMAVQNFFGSAADMLRSFAEVEGKNRQTAFTAYKIAAVATATIDAHKAFTNALATVPFPFNYVAAAAVFATAITRVRSILSQQLNTGGAQAAPAAVPPVAPVALEPPTRSGPQVINITVEGTLVSMDRLGRDLVPVIQQAIADGIG